MLTEQVKKSKGISTILGLIVVTFFLAIAALFPFIFLRVHIERIIITEVKHSSARNILLALLSSTETDSLDGRAKPVYEILAEHIVLSQKPDVNFIQAGLEKWVESKSFKLYYIENNQEVVLAQSGNPSQYEERVKILLPLEDRLFEELVLVID